MRIKNQMMVYALWIYNGKIDECRWHSEVVTVKSGERTLIKFAVDHIKAYTGQDVVFGPVPLRARGFVTMEPTMGDGLLIIASRKDYLQRGYDMMKASEEWNGDRVLPLVEWADAKSEQGKVWEMAEIRRKMAGKRIIKGCKMSSGVRETLAKI